MIQQLSDIIKHPKKKTVKTNSISSNASIASPSSTHSNSNNGTQPFRFDSIANKIKTELNSEENVSSLKTNASPVNADSSIDKCVIDTINKKKKKSIISSASASPQTLRPPLSPTPPIVTPTFETKSPNQSLFSSIFSSSLNPPIAEKVVETHKPMVELSPQNVNPVKRTQSDAGIEVKKMKKPMVTQYVLINA